MTIARLPSTDAACALTRLAQLSVAQHITESDLNHPTTVILPVAFAPRSPLIVRPPDASTPARPRPGQMGSFIQSVDRPELRRFCRNPTHQTAQARRRVDSSISTPIRPISRQSRHTLPTDDHAPRTACSTPPAGHRPPASEGDGVQGPPAAPQTPRRRSHAARRCAPLQPHRPGHQ